MDTAGLYAAVQDACMRRERDHLERLSGRLAGLAPEETFDDLWAHVSEPSVWPMYRLGAEHDLARRAWTDALAPLVERVGVPASAVGREVLLWVAVCRGFLWDLISGGDVDEINAAARRFFVRYSRPAPAMLGC
jgi:hypothetical protein